MATQLKGRSSKSSFGDDDLLDSLFDDKTELPVRGKATRSGQLNRTSTTDNIFSMLAEEIKRDGGDTEDSDVSAADPNDILKNMKDMDEMDADLFTFKKKPSSAPAQRKKDSTALESEVKPEGADEPTTTAGGRKPNSAPSSTAQNYKFNFSAKAVKKQSDMTFDDDKDDLMDALGFDGDKKNGKKKEITLWSNKERSEPPQKPRTKLDEILENLASPGERKDQPQEKPQHDKTFSVKEDDLTFGSYQPTLGSTPEGRQSRRQSVRFSTEDISPLTPEKKPTTLTSTRQRGSADWLGLKMTDTLPDDDDKETKTSAEPPSSPALERRPSLTSSRTTSAAKATADTPALTDHITKPEVSKSQQREEEEEDDWFAGLLSRKKALSGVGEDLDLTTSKQVTSQALRGREDTSVKEASSTFLGEPGPTARSTPIRETRTEQDCPPPQLTGPLPVSAASTTQPQPQSQPHHLPSDKGSRVPAQASDETPQQLPLLNPISAVPPGSMWSVPQQMQNALTAIQQQVMLSADSLQQLLLQQQMMQSQLLGLGGLGGVVDAGVLQKRKEREQQPGDYQALQARIIQLEGQVKTLQLEQEQSQMLLENVQQRHKQDMESRVKLLEESASQREMQARQECEDLMERLATVTRSAEEERSELQAQYQRKLGQAQQDRDREVERLRELQRKSILEMKKDHEDQVQRLKKLKDEEIDAVTSATSQTRSLTVVIEQMEQVSSRLGDLSSRVESTHEHTAHGLEQGARHRDEQLRMMQECLEQQQKAMVEERAYLKEIISRMDTQQRQLENERWKMTAEQAKAESTQRGLDGERQALSMQINIEREELDRAKSALLEEQKSVMQQCAEERRKLAADWAHFHTVEKQRRERAEREVSSLLEKREGSIMSLVQEQADLKLHTAELKQKEMNVAQERETVERLREELDREKNRISSKALRLKTRAQEVEAFSKLAADKYEEGERALQEAKRVEAEHEARLRTIHTQTERLRQHEQRMLQQQMRLNHLQKDTERLRFNAPITSLPQVTPLILPDEGPALTPPLNIPANSQRMALQASLALWRYTAEKDRECLEEEKIFLENLK